MATLDLGKVRITFGGSWDENTEYELLTIVDSPYGVKYISKQNVPVGTQLSDDAYWEPISGYFVEQYQGAKDADPSTRNDGTSLQPGDLYFNTEDNRLKVYTGSSWLEVTAPDDYVPANHIVKYGGEWDSSVSYSHPISVFHNGDLYLSLQNSSGEEPTINSDYWFLVRRKKSFIVIDADYNANPNDVLAVDTSNNSVTVTLPSTPTDFTKITFIDLNGTFDTNNLIVSLGDSKNTIMGLAEDMTVDVKNIIFDLIFINGNWKIKY